MSLKLSAGCECCPDDEGTCPNTCTSGTFQDEYDVTLSGISDTSNCDVCEGLNGTFSLSDPVRRTDFSDGWSGNSMVFAKGADVPSGTTEACVWRNIWSAGCDWYPTIIGFGCYSNAALDIYGLCLAKFRISATEFIWRMIVNYELTLYCDCGVLDTVQQSGGWYWQLDETTRDCSLSGSETWTAYVPTVNLFVSCTYLFESLTFADYCGGTLSMTNIENG